MMYRTGNRIAPYQVRAATFGRRWRGLDPDEVYGYLRQVADEMDGLLREVRTTSKELERIRQGLWQWRTRHIGCKFADPDFGPVTRSADSGAARPSAVDPTGSEGGSGSGGGPGGDEPGRGRRNRGRW
nr:DivIVA domain-containing protein [Micromonospora sp. DSM 115978]